MKMVVRKVSSTYRQTYSPLSGAKLDEQQRSYSSLLGYRADRREHEHQHVPIEWDDNDQFTASSSSSSTSSTVQRGLHTHHNQQNHCNNVDKFQNNNNVRDVGVQTPTKQRSYDKCDKAVQTPEKDDLQRATSLTRQGVKPKPKKPSIDYLRKAKAKYRKVPAHRVKSAPATQSVGEPFIQYGMADTEQGTGMKRTHNIRASSNVYEAAMRAARRHDIEVEQKKKEQQTRLAANKEKQRQKVALFNEQLQRDTCRWTTEYRSHYPSYDNDVYKKSLASRVPRPMSKLYLPF